MPSSSHSIGTPVTWGRADRAGTSPLRRGHRQTEDHSRIRLSFADESFLDVRALTVPSEEFWRAVEDHGRA